MKISTNLTEIKELFAHHLGINVSELELTIEDAQVESNDGWIVNTQTDWGHPYTLGNEDVIDVILSDGLTDIGTADAWDKAWDINNDYRHIVKYRKVKQ
jgi:hypothetical protein